MNCSPVTVRAREALEVYGRRYVWPSDDYQLGILPAAAGSVVPAAAAAIGFGRRRKKRKPATPRAFAVPIWSHTHTGPAGEALPANERERYAYLLRLRDAGWDYTVGRGWHRAGDESIAPTPPAAQQWPYAYGYPPAYPGQVPMMGPGAPGLVSPTGAVAPGGAAAPLPLLPILAIGLGGLFLLSMMKGKRR